MTPIMYPPRETLARHFLVDLVGVPTRVDAIRIAAGGGSKKRLLRGSLTSADTPKMIPVSS